MAASSNPPGNNNQEGSGNGNGATNNGSSVLHDNAVVGPTQAALRHNPGLAVEWTSDEQSLLEDLLTKFGSERNIVRYAKIAMQLKDKTVRDVALRCRWLSSARYRGYTSKHPWSSVQCRWPYLHVTPSMGLPIPNGDPRHPSWMLKACPWGCPLALVGEKKENGKRRKDDHNSSRKSKDKKAYPCPSVDGLRHLSDVEKVTDSMAKSVSHAVNRSNGPPYAQPVISVDSDDGIPYKVIGGVTGQLLEQNAQALDQISANFTAFTIHENINLFCQARNNILTILNDLNDMPEIMKQMPPLPVNLNEDLANSILDPLEIALIKDTLDEDFNFDWDLAMRPSRNQDPFDGGSSSRIGGAWWTNTSVAGSASFLAGSTHFWPTDGRQATDASLREYLVRWSRKVLEMFNPANRGFRKQNSGLLEREPKVLAHHCQFCESATSRRSLTTAFIWVSMATNENLPPNVIKQLATKLKNLDETPPEGIKVGVNDDDFSIIYADIEGPVRCLLIEPFPESALNEQAGKMLLENYEEYARHARLYTGIHALKQKPKFKSGAISESTTALNVDQSNTSVLSIDEKKASSGAALPLPSPLASTTTFTKGGNGQDQFFFFFFLGFG
ncbi:hypothetical protein TEA_018041 [Camellia sinensis var. sinensis]|uniref:Myb-like domain-containing protein n=1 Tax=Camellia sinensis var. sinensis TaxID=542762 RepID=A0A4S4DER9_CAMSN|nr:hypothetical protein TEA_018041 [Camellia sinensis var. sinensis]